MGVFRRHIFKDGKEKTHHSFFFCFSEVLGFGFLSWGMEGGKTGRAFVRKGDG